MKRDQFVYFPGSRRVCTGASIVLLLFIHAGCKDAGAANDLHCRIWLQDIGGVGAIRILDEGMSPEDAYEAFLNDPPEMYRESDSCSPVLWGPLFNPDPAAWQKDANPPNQITVVVVHKTLENGGFQVTVRSSDGGVSAKDMMTLPDWAEKP